MPSYPPKKNTAYEFSVGLASQGNPSILQASPTISAGDVKVSIDGGAFNNLTNLPTVTPPASKRIGVSLTAAEMNGDNITVLFSDQAGDEWNDLLISIETSTRQIDDLAYPSKQIPDSVSVDGVLPTWEQALYEIHQFLLERVVAGTTVTVKKVDGATNLFTLQLNDPTNPTSITRLT